MQSIIPRERIEAAIHFHGHVCPGIFIGIRAAELCLRKFGHNDDTPIVAVCETDMCGVDAIQSLIGCTLGKGNFIHRDYGKTAFTFYRKSDGAGIRAILKPEAMGPNQQKCLAILKKDEAGQASAEDLELLEVMREEQQKMLMTASLEELFELSTPTAQQPKPAKVLATLICEHCGEGTMESRTRRFDGQTLCIPCFTKVEQKT